MKIIKHKGLEWTDFSNKQMTWQEAKDYAKSIGFRLPTRDEIKTLSDDGNLPNQKRLKDLGFTYRFWTWTNEEYDINNIFIADFFSSNLSGSDKNKFYYVLCVRDSKNDKGTFNWALNAMKYGNKVRRNIWHKSMYLKIGDTVVVNQNNEEYTIHFDVINSTGWEIYKAEDDWNIGQERHWFKVYNSDTICDGYRVKHVKTLKEKILEDIETLSWRYDDIEQMKYIHNEGIKEILDKRFGF